MEPTSKFIQQVQAEDWASFQRVNDRIVRVNQINIGSNPLKLLSTIAKSTTSSGYTLAPRMHQKNWAQIPVEKKELIIGRSEEYERLYRNSFGKDLIKLPINHLSLLLDNFEQGPALLQFLKKQDETKAPIDQLLAMDLQSLEAMLQQLQEAEWQALLQKQQR